MKYCTNCGHELHDEATVCINCGESCTPAKPAKKDAPHGGFTVLGIFCPIEAIVCFIVFKCTGYHKRAKSALKGAIIGAIISAAASSLIYVFYIIYYVLYIALLAGSSFM